MAKKIQYRIQIDTDPVGFNPNYPLRMSAPEGNQGVNMSSSTATITGDTTKV